MEKEKKGHSPEKPKKESAPEKEKKGHSPEKPKKESAPEKENTEHTPEKPKKESAPEKAKKEHTPEKISKDYTPRLWTLYQKEIVPRMIKRFGYKSAMQVPKIVKISLNMGVGEAIQDPKFIEAAAVDLTSLAGQKVVLTKAKKSISNFKLRQGMAIGCRVTLRRQRMYEFLDRLLNVAIPRIRDFRGLEQAGFDGRGNFTLGIREHIIFPEINYDKVLKIRGLNVTIGTTAKTDEEAFELLREFGMPFRSKEKNTNTT